MSATIRITDAMVSAAQESYDGWEEYGLTDTDMAKAIAAALRSAGIEVEMAVTPPPIVSEPSASFVNFDFVRREHQMLLENALAVGRYNVRSELGHVAVRRPRALKDEG